MADRKPHKRPPGKKQLSLRKSLRKEHFSKLEVAEFEKLWRKSVPPGNLRAKPQLVPTLFKLVDDRRELWADFSKKASERGWGSQKKASEWHWEVGRLYTRLSKRHTGNFFVTKDRKGKPIRRQISPWALYDATQDSLPVEDQWDTPRAGRGKPTGLRPVFIAERRYKEKALRDDIKYLNTEIRLTGDPSGNLGAQMRSLQYNLKTGSF